jgi:endonuclease/exonuclease/phosphatase family metal-dependent hydrolase
MIRVGTYNTGDFSGADVPAGSDKAREAFREVMNAEGVELWALQEDVGFFNPETGEMPYEAIYSGYKNYKRSGEKKYNFKAFLTDLPISEVERIYYTGAPKFGHPWFLHAQARIDGKDVCLISLHYDWQDCDLRHLQIRQTIEFASRYEYAMILGDYNPDDFVNGEERSKRLTYEEDLAPFREAGFRVANADRFGMFTTIIGRQEPFPCDNIVVSPNIRIHNVGRIYRDWMNDHAPLWADLELC